VVLERVHRVARGLVAPHGVDEDVGGDDLVRAEEQQREKRALALAAERERLPIGDDLERSENTELQRGLLRRLLTRLRHGLSEASARPQRRRRHS
jgi:predicted metal-dependent peptidase